MATAIVDYNIELPEIPGRVPWQAPDSYLVKDPSAQGGWRVVEDGRRPSDRLLIEKIRAAVGQWRSAGYAGASDVTRRLFDYWFDEDHGKSSDLRCKE